MAEADKITSVLDTPADPLTPDPTQGIPESQTVVFDSGSPVLDDVPPSANVEFMEADQFEDMFPVQSINKQEFFTQQRKNPEFGPRIQPLGATVYKGNFISQFGERINRMTTTQLKRDFANLGIVAGQSISEIGERIEGEDVFDTFGTKLRNFGFHMGAEANRSLSEREDLFSIDGTLGAFAADVTYSIAATIGLTVAGAVVLPGATFAAATLATASIVPVTVFALQSALGVTAEGLEANASFKKSLAYGVVTGVAVGFLERIGMNRIFAKTFVKSKGFVLRRIGAAIGFEGATEGAQQTVEIGAGFGTGVRTPENTSLMDVVAETMYASAVGAFSGGLMVGSVAIPQRHKGIKTLRAMGMDKAKATEVYDTTQNEVLDQMLIDVGEDFGFDSVANETQNRIFKTFDTFLNQRESFTQAQLEQTLKDIEAGEPSVAILKIIDAESRTLVTEEGLKTPRPVPTGRITKVDKLFEDAQKIDNEVERVNIEGGIPEIAVPTFDVNTSQAKQLAIKGRILFINDRLRAIAKNARKNRKLIEEKTKAAEGKEPTVDAIEKDILNDRGEALDLVAEANAIRQNPRGVNLAGDKITVRGRDLVVATAGLTRQIIRNAKDNFKSGRSSVKQEIAFVRAALNKLINVPGISKSSRKMLKDTFKNVTPFALAKQLPVIEEAVESVRNEAFIKEYLDGVAALVKFFKKGSKRQGGRANVDVATQKVGNAFVAEFERKGTNPVEARKALDGTPEKTIQFYASMLKTGKNGFTGEDLAPLDYQRYFRAINDLAIQGKKSKAFNTAVERKNNDEFAKRVVDDIESGKVSVDKAFGTASVSDLLNAAFANVWATQPGVLTVISRNAEQNMGPTFTQMVGSLSTGERKGAAIMSFIRSEQTDMIKRIFGLETSEQVRDKRYADNSRLSKDILTIRQESEAKVDPETGEETLGEDKPDIQLSVAQAREKLMLSYRPEARKKMLKGRWTEAGIRSLVEDKKLTDSDVQYVAAQMELYAKLFPMISDVYAQQTGFILPQGLNYSPILTVRQFESGDSMTAALLDQSGNGQPSQNGQGFLLPVTGKDTDLQDIGDDQKLLRYGKDISYYVGTAETVSRIGKVFGNDSVRKAVKSKFGKDMVTLLDRYVEVFTKNSLNQGNAQLYSTANRWVSNVAQSYIVAKPIQMAKQFTSFFTAIQVMGLPAWQKGFRGIPAAIKSGEIRELINDPFFRNRAASNVQGREMKAVQETIDFDNQKSLFDFFNNEKLKELNEKFNRVINDPRFDHFFFMPTQLGDFGGIVGAAWPLYKWYQTPAGGSKTKPQALTLAIKHADDTQQSGSNTQVSRFMLNNDPIMRSIMLYTQAPIQFVNAAMKEIGKIGTPNFSFTNKSHLKQFANMYLALFVLVPQAFEFVSRGFQLPDLEDDRERSRLSAQLAIGPFGLLPVMGPMLEWAVANLMAGTYNLATDGIESGPKVPRLEELAGPVLEIPINVGRSIVEMIKVIKTGGPDLDSSLKALSSMIEATNFQTGRIGGAARVGINAVRGVSSTVEDGIVDGWRGLLTLTGLSPEAVEKK